jgi:hypothetical protein
MLHSTLICGLGLLVFAFSSFVPTSRFAWLMAAMLAIALLGDLLLLPALLAGPLGRFFQRGAGTRASSRSLKAEPALQQQLQLDAAL